MQRPALSFLLLSALMATMPAAFAQTTLDAAAGLALATSRHCMGCHRVDRKLVGPAFQSVAARYAGKPEMQAKLAAKIRQGGGGVWGAVPMPANPQVSEADAMALAGWVLSRR